MMPPSVLVNRLVHSCWTTHDPSPFPNKLEKIVLMWDWWFLLRLEICFLCFFQRWFPNKSKLSNNQQIKRRRIHRILSGNCFRLQIRWYVFLFWIIIHTIYSKTRARFTNSSYSNDRLNLLLVLRTSLEPKHQIMYSRRESKQNLRCVYLRDAWTYHPVNYIY